MIEFVLVDTCLFNSAIFWVFVSTWLPILVTVVFKLLILLVLVVTWLPILVIVELIVLISDSVTSAANLLSEVRCNPSP